MLALLSVALATRALPTTAQQDRLMGLDAYVEQSMEAWGVPGAAIAVVRNDSLIYSRGFGVREVGKDARVTPETIFAIGSTSKAFTATALGVLVDSGTVAWDAPVRWYLPWFQVADPWVSHELTVRDLLTHRSGLAREDNLWYGSDLKRREVLERAAALEQERPLRTSYLYNNIAFMAAGEIIPELTGQSWDAFVAERLLEPLGMRLSTTSVDSLEGMANVAQPHAEIDGRTVPVPYRNIDNAGPAGSINSNVLEMANWVRFNLGEGGFDGREIVEPATLAELHAPAFVIDDQFFRLMAQAAGASFVTYALGWTVQDFEGEKLIWHGGNIDGMSAAVGFVPSHDIGVVVLTNMNQALLPYPLMLRVLDQLTGGEPVDWAGRLLEQVEQINAQEEERRAEVEAGRVLGTSPSLPLDRYAGSYLDNLYGDAVVTSRENRLSLRVGAAFDGTLEHWHYDTFRVTWMDRIMGQAFVTFRLDARGQVAAMDVQGQTEFLRVHEAEGGRPN